MKQNLAQTVLPFKLEIGDRDDDVTGLAGLPLVYEFMEKSGLGKKIGKCLKLSKDHPSFEMYEIARRKIAALAFT